MSTTSVEARLTEFEERIVGRSITEATYTDYARWIKRSEAWKNRRGGGEPDISLLEDFDNYLSTEDRADYPWANGRGGAAPASYAYNSRINAISAVLLWLQRDYGLRVPETPKDICLGEPEPFDPTYLEPADVADIIESADGDCDIDGCQAAARLSYDCILRGSELVRVRREDIDLSAGTIYIRASKGSQNSEIGIGRRTASALERIMEEHPDRDRLFTNSYGRAWKAGAWTTHFWRQHSDAGSHAVGRHSAIMHRLEGADPPFMDESFEDEDFGSVYRRARHQNPSQTADYARIVGVDIPTWAGD